MKNQVFIPIIIAVFIILGFTGEAGYFAYKADKIAKEKETETFLTEQVNSLQETKLEISRLKQENTNNNEELKRQLEVEKNARVKSEKTSQDKTASVSPEKQMSKADVVKYWRDSVLKISCLGHNSSDEPVILSGSGFGFKLAEGTVFFTTNKHVVFPEAGYSLTSCVVGVPDGESFTVSLSTLKTHNKFDYALMVSDDSGKDFNITFKFNYCPANSANLGDEILILGYPTIGSQNGITVTDGIISGSDEDYFVTSAKIEKGNSGGAAILIKKNCYLGLPTFANIGEVESLGRILKIEKVINYDALNKLING